MRLPCSYNDSSFSNDFPFFRNLNRQLSKAVYKTCSITKASFLSGSRIRWFKYCNYKVRYQCGFDLIAMNAKETGITRYTPINLLRAIYLSLSPINKESLVFLFDREDLPNVLFCADSDLSFCSNIDLKDDSIVTAPHHGSEDNKQAYSVINGTKLYFVRSDKCQSKRPGNTYCKQSNRYCIICRNQAKNSKQKVELNYKSGLLTTLAPPCICC